MYTYNYFAKTRETQETNKHTKITVTTHSSWCVCIECTKLSPPNDVRVSVNLMHLRLHVIRLVIQTINSYYIQISQFVVQRA